MKNQSIKKAAGWLGIVLIAVAFGGESSFAGPRSQPKGNRRAAPDTPRAKSAGGGGQERTMASVGGVQEAEKPLEVTGQSRNLNMVLVLKNDKDKIKFVEVRRSYRDEVKKTQY